MQEAMEPAEARNETATIQLKEAGGAERVTDETGALKGAQDVRAIAGNITDVRVQQLLARELATGKKEIKVDVSQVGATPEVIRQLEAEQRRLRQKGVNLSILGLDSADLQRADVKGMQNRDGVQVFTKRDTAKAFAGNEAAEQLAA